MHELMWCWHGHEVRGVLRQQLAPQPLDADSFDYCAAASFLKVAWLLCTRARQGNLAHIKAYIACQYPPAGIAFLAVPLPAFRLLLTRELWRIPCA